VRLTRTEGSVLTARRTRAFPGRAAAVLAAVCAAAALLSRGAHASELSWDGPTDCAAAEQLSFEVERALGTPLESAGHLQFHVRVESAESTTSARLRVSSEVPGEVSKERLLVASDCSKLVDTLAVAISLAIGASEAKQAPPAPEARLAATPPRSPAPPPAPIDAGVPEPPESDAPGNTPELAALVAAVADQGSLPAPALGASLGLALAWERATLRALGTLFVDQSVEVTADRGAELDLIFGTLQACTNVLSASSTFSLPLCLGMDIGALSGVGVGIPRPRRASMVWLAPRIDAGVFWDIPDTRLGVGALFTVAAPLNRDEFVLDRIGTVHRPSRVVGRASFGIELQL
jgi:hypothetical protein